MSSANWRAAGAHPVGLRLLRSTPDFELFAGEDGDGRALVWLAPLKSADAQLAQAALDRIRVAHDLVRHPRVPRVKPGTMDDGRPCLMLDCPAVADGVGVVELLRRCPDKIPFGAADAFIVGIREALETAHAVEDPWHPGRPLCLGRLAAGNVLFDAQGQHYVIGLGHNLAVEQVDRSLRDDSLFFGAPELAQGGVPNPSGDYVALLLFTRALMTHIDLSPLLGRLMHGEPGPNDAPVLAAMQWVDDRVIQAPQAERASIAEAVAVADRIRALAGVQLDADGFAAFIRQLLESAPRPPVRMPPALELVLGPDAAWITGPDGAKHRLGKPLRRIILALVEQHRGRSTEPLTIWALLEAGWPGESPQAESGANRVYVALSRLRALGLRDVVERFDDGYRLAPQVIVRQENGKPSVHP